MTDWQKAAASFLAQFLNSLITSSPYLTHHHYDMLWYLRNYDIVRERVVYCGIGQLLLGHREVISLFGVSERDGRIEVLLRLNQ